MLARRVSAESGWQTRFRPLGAECIFQAVCGGQPVVEYHQNRLKFLGFPSADVIEEQIGHSQMTLEACCACQPLGTTYRIVPVQGLVPRADLCTNTALQQNGLMLQACVPPLNFRDEDSGKSS